MVNYSKIFTTLILFVIVTIGQKIGVIPKTQYFRLVDVTIVINNDKASEILYTTKQKLDEKNDLIIFKPNGESYLTQFEEGRKKIYKIEKSDEPSYIDMLNRSSKIKWLYYMCMIAVVINFFFLKSKFGFFGSIAITIISLVTYTALAWIIIDRLDWIGWGGFFMFWIISFGVKLIYTGLYSS